MENRWKTHRRFCNVRLRTSALQLQLQVYSNSNHADTGLVAVIGSMAYLEQGQAEDRGQGTGDRGQGQDCRQGTGTGLRTGAGLSTGDRGRTEDRGQGLD